MKYLNIGSFTILFFLLGFTYFESLGFDFTHWDDFEQVVENSKIHKISANNWLNIFSSTAVGMYQPLTSIIYSIVYFFSDGNSYGFHISSLILHWLNCILVFRLFKFFDLDDSKSFLLVTIFALHPMQVESVAWISAFSTLTFTFFGLLCILFYINHNSKYYYLSLLLFILACLSKSAAVFIPIILAFFNSVFFKKTIKEQIKSLSPFLIISVLFGLITILSRDSAGHLSDVSQTFSLFERVFLISHSYLFYLTKFLFPINLSAFYAFPENEAYLPVIYYLSLLVFLGLIWGVWRFRSNKIILFSIFWYSASIFLVLQIISVGSQITTDRYIYFPMIGILIVFIPLLKRLNSAFIYTLFAIPFLLAFISKERTMVWKNDKTLWEDVISKNPNVSQAYNNLASFEIEKGDLSTALSKLNKAIDLRPNYADAFSNRASIYVQFGEYDLAFNDYEKALSLKPHENTYFNRANLYNQTGQLQNAINDYSKSIDMKEKEDVYTNRAYCYLKMQNEENAIKDLKKALALNTNYVPALYLYGMTLLKSNKLSEACSYFNKAAFQGDKKSKDVLNQYCKNN